MNQRAPRDQDGRKRCKDQVTIDKEIVEQITRGKRNLFSWYIDYSKLPQSWLINFLRLHDLNVKLKVFGNSHGRVLIYPFGKDKTLEVSFKDIHSLGH